MVFSTGIRQFIRSSSRAYSTTAASVAPLKSSAWGPAIAGAGLLIGSYFYYSTRAAVAAESALKGDKQWVDFKLVKIDDLTNNVCITFQQF